MEAQILHSEDGRTRCWWCGTDPTYVAYHDTEWGVALRDEGKLFELLLLEGAQAGLSWITVLRKRETYRLAFDQFDPERIAAYGPTDVARLLDDAGIVRNRAKVAAFIGNSQALLRMHDSGETLSELLWSFEVPVAKRPRRLAVGSDIPVSTPESLALSKELIRRGWKFVGPTIIYAYLQSSGVVDDHLTECWKSGP